MEYLLPPLIVVTVYVLLGVAVAIAAYTDARGANPETRWHAGEWAQAIGLGPLTILLLLLQRIVPDPPDEREPPKQ